VDHIETEDHRDVQARLESGLLDLVDVVHAHQVQHRADLAAADLIEQGLARRAVRAGGAGHLQLADLLGQGHLADQRIDLAGDGIQAPQGGRGGRGLRGRRPGAGRWQREQRRRCDQCGESCGNPYRA